MNRRVVLASKGRLRARRRLRPVSAKRRAGQKDWDAVYADVDARSLGFCEVRLTYQNEFSGAPYESKCTKKGDGGHHHTVKPRTAHHDASHVMRICRNHHRMVDNPFSAGRLVTIPLGAGRFHCRIVTAASKDEARRLGLIA